MTSDNPTAAEGLAACPNPWCLATTKQLPVALKREGWRVVCACGVATHRHSTEAEAITAWNRRPIPAGDDLDCGAMDIAELGHFVEAHRSRAGERQPVTLPGESEAVIDARDEVAERFQRIADCYPDNESRHVVGVSVAEARQIAAALTAIGPCAGEVERLREALERARSDCRLGHDVLGNSGPEFASVREGFKIIEERIATALSHTPEAEQ